MKLIGLKEIMNKKNKTKITESTKYTKIKTLNINDFVINEGDYIKIKGEHGVVFKFISLTKNNENGLEWVDCIEYEKGIAKAMRAFSIDRVKRIPKKRKHVSRT